MERYLDTEGQFFRTKPLPEFNVGDTVDVRTLIKEGDKERIQVFNGTVIAKKGRGLSEMFTVRRIVQGEGVERTFPMHSPKVVDLDIKTQAVVRRAKLYYLRGRTGKGTRLRERLGGKPTKTTGA